METNRNLHFRHSYSDWINEYLGQYIDLSKKALTKEISDFFLQADKETQIALLQGMFDGDGTAIKDGRVSYSTSSYKLAKQLQIMLLNFGMVVGIYPRTTGENSVIQSETYKLLIRFRK